MTTVNTEFAKFKVKQDETYDRIVNIEVDRQALSNFFKAIQDIKVERVEYVPFERFYLADQLREVLGKEFQDVIRTTLHDRNTGGFITVLDKEMYSIDEYILFSTALTHLIGVPNLDGMSGKYYARFSVKHSFDSDTYLRQAYRKFYLHTDGTFVNEQTDWLLMMKLQEKNAVGGESLLLHLDDWEDLEKFRNHPFANNKYEFTQKGRASKNIDDVVYQTTFFENNNAPCIRFNDQCSAPHTLEEAMYHREISESLDSSSQVKAIKLPIGGIIMLNNLFWLHGRDAFEKNENLYRELLRQRGYFAQV